MSIIALKCPNCGGNLEFEDSREFGFCQFCGTKVMIREEINKTVNNTVNNFNSTTIISNDHNEQHKKMLAAAQKALNEENYTTAKKIAETVVAQDLTVADAYRIILLSVALKDFKQYGFVTVDSNPEIEDNFEKYHLYSDDPRTQTEILTDAGIVFDEEPEKEPEPEEITPYDELVSNAKAGVALINSLLYKTRIDMEQMEQVKTASILLMKWPSLLTDLGIRLKDVTPFFDDFHYERKGKPVSFYSDWEEIKEYPKDYALFHDICGKDAELNLSVIDEFKSKYTFAVESKYPLSGFGKITNKSNREHALGKIDTIIRHLQEILLSRQKLKENYDVE